MKLEEGHYYWVLHRCRAVPHAWDVTPEVARWMEGHWYVTGDECNWKNVVDYMAIAGPIKAPWVGTQAVARLPAGTEEYHP